MDPESLSDSYVGLWNEADAEARRERIAELWAKDGYQVVEPPQDVRDAAATLGMTAALEARGHEALEARVTRAYEDFVDRGGYEFRAHGTPKRLGNIVRLKWEMIPVSGGPVAGAGLDILVLDDDGHIQADYQFVET
jgi:hypothetical protein